MWVLALVAAVPTVVIGASVWLTRLWRHAPDEHCTSTVVGALPEAVRDRAREYEALGYGPSQATVVHSDSPISTFVAHLTDPTGSFDLQFSCRRFGDSGREGPTVGVVALSRYPGGTFSTSPAVEISLLDGDQTQRCVTCTPAELVTAHVTVLDALRERGAHPLPHDRGLAQTRYSTRHRETIHAMRVVRWTQVVGSMGGLFRRRRGRAPIRGTRRLDHLAARLG
jgi:hypothetical protein